MVRTNHLGIVAGHRSYTLMGEMAEMERALTNYTVERLLQNGFNLIFVPDILHRDVVEGCGLNTRGKRAQVSSENLLLDCNL